MFRHEAVEQTLVRSHGTVLLARPLSHSALRIRSFPKAAATARTEPSAATYW